MDKGKSEPKVTFVIEIRSANTLQKEAGRRLFKRLVARAQASNQTRNKQKNINTKTQTGKVGVGGRRKPPPI